MAAMVSQASCKSTAASKRSGHLSSLRLTKLSVLAIDAGIFSKPAICIGNAASFIITSEPNATIFNCDDSLKPKGVVFSIYDSAETNQKC
jgi:hypothetical protein